MTTQKKPYPKSYIVAAVAFGVLLCGIWTLYGMMYTKDSQINKHCKMGILANTLSGYAADKSYGSAADTFVELKDLADTLELNAEEAESLKQLASDVFVIMPGSDTPYVELDNNGKHQIIVKASNVNPTVVTNIEHSARCFAEKCQENADVIMANSKKMHIAGDYAMMAIFFAVIVAILVVGQLVRKKDAAIAIKEEETSVLENRVAGARQKVHDIALMNILMDCGNRYALGNYIKEKMDKKESLCLAQFEFRDYDNILSMVGYAQMDDLMEKAADNIKSMYSKYGTLFTLDGREFVFQFNDDVTGIDAKCDEIRSTIRNTLVTLMHIDSVILSGIVHSMSYHTGDAVLTALHTAVARSAYAPAASSSPMMYQTPMTSVNTASMNSNHNSYYNTDSSLSIPFAT